MLFLLTAMKWLVALALILIFSAIGFLKFAPVFGGTPGNSGCQSISAQTDNCNGKVFVNLRPTTMESGNHEKPSMLSWLASVLNPPKGKHPAEPLPSERLEQSSLVDSSITWLGHSTMLVKTASKTLLFDPVLNRASPVFLAGKPFAMTHPPMAADLPPIDAVLISHDHYDHLDYHTVRAIQARVGRFYVPLGVKAHLKRWGVAEEKITELDWYQSAQLGTIRFTLTPSRHLKTLAAHPGGEAVKGCLAVGNV